MDDEPNPGTPRPRRPSPTSSSTPKMDNIAQRLAWQVSQQLPGILEQLVQEGYDPAAIPWQLECSLTTANPGLQTAGSRFPIAAVDLGAELSPFSPSATPFCSGGYDTHGSVMNHAPPLQQAMRTSSIGSQSASSTGTVTPVYSHEQQMVRRPSKRRRTTIQRSTAVPALQTAESSSSSIDAMQQRGSNMFVTPVRKKRTSDNPVHQPSTLEKYIGGVWESLYSGSKIDITEVVEQWQAIESNGQPKLLTDVDHEVAMRAGTGVCKSSPTRGDTTSAAL